MDDLVSRKEMLEAILFYRDNTWPEDLVARLPEIINELPSVDAVPVSFMKEYMNEPLLGKGIMMILYMWKRRKEKDNG